MYDTRHTIVLFPQHLHIPRAPKDVRVGHVPTIQQHPAVLGVEGPVGGDNDASIHTLLGQHAAPARIEDHGPECFGKSRGGPHSAVGKEDGCVAERVGVRLGRSEVQLYLCVVVAVIFIKEEVRSEVQLLIIASDTAR